MSDILTQKKLSILDQLLQSGKITQDMYDANKDSIVNSLKDLPARIESEGGARMNIPKNIPSPSANTAEQMGKWKATNVSNVVKTAADNDLALRPELRNRKYVESLAQDVGKAAEESAPLAEEVGQAGGWASKLRSGGKVMSMLGPLAKALAIGGGAMGLAGAGQKAMAGDFGGAGLQAADTITNYVPLVGEAKMALTPSELGTGSDVAKGESNFDFSPYKTNPAVNDSNINKPTPTSYEDMKSEIGGDKSPDSLKRKLGIK